MIEAATGLVLRTYPLTETSLIVHWLTPVAGRLATVAKGARRPKSLFRGKLDLFYEADFSFNRSRRSELHNLREVTVRQTHSLLRQDLACLQQASYCAGLVELATETETPLPAVFELMRGMLAHLAPGTPPAPTIFAFEIKLLSELGLEPDLTRARLSDGAKAIIRMLDESAWDPVARLGLSRPQAGELGQFLNEFLAYHLGRVPKGRDAALGAWERPSPSAPPDPHGKGPGRGSGNWPGMAE
ncbi:MAG TPA: DNA repair protein RecO [Verrucomicrobiae bacterium]